MALKVKHKYKLPKRSKSDYTLPQRTYKREQRKASARRFSNSILALLIVAITGGMIYTWYNGQNQLASAAQAAPEYTPRAVIKPSKIPSDAKVGVAQQTVTGELKAGDNAALSVRTNPEADCSIVVKYNNVVAVDSGLITKQADEFGVASWSWTVAAGTPAGTWPAEVTCKNKKHSAMLRVDIKVL